MQEMHEEDVIRKKDHLIIILGNYRLKKVVFFLLIFYLTHAFQFETFFYRKACISFVAILIFI